MIYVTRIQSNVYQKWVKSFHMNGNVQFHENLSATSVCRYLLNLLWNFLVKETSVLINIKWIKIFLLSVQYMPDTIIKIVRAFKVQCTWAWNIINCDTIMSKNVNFHLEMIRRNVLTIYRACISFTVHSIT